jgi:hypothetical protein
MNVLLALIILGAGEGDDTFWTQMLVLVILAGLGGIIGLAKAKAGRSKTEDPPTHQQKWTKPSLTGLVGKTPNLFAAAKAKTAAKPENLSRKKQKDTQSGMELLGSDFLLKVVENTNDGSDEKDVTMRKLNFKELARRGELNSADSKALKEYAVNKGNIYGKDIQCEAIRILAGRTAKGKTGN